MTYLIILGIYLAILFIIGFFSRRSMGYPALALTAGAVMAELWTDSLTPLVAEAGIILVQPPLASLVAITLTLVPALILMIRAPKVTGHHHAWFGSLVFAVLGVMLTYGAFSNAVVMDESSEDAVRQIVGYQPAITTAAIVLAILDVLLYRRPSVHKKKDH